MAFPAGTRVVQAQEHLQRHITWVQTFTTRPWAISNMEPGTLVMLSLRGLSRTELLGLPRLVQTLTMAEVSAMALSDDSPEVISAAAGHDLPVLVFPPDAALPDVERAVTRLIIDRDSQVQRRAAEIYQTLIQLALDQVPPQEMAESLANAAGRVVYLEDEYGVLQAVAAPPDHESTGLPSASEAPSVYSARAVLGISTSAPAATGAPQGCIVRVLDNSRYTVYSAPITLGGTVAGFATLLGHTDQMQDLDEAILTRAALAFAFPIMRQRAIVETQTRLQGSFLENLFAGTITDEEEIASRARYLGHDLTEPYETACLMLDEASDGRRSADEAQRAGVWSSLQDMARRELLDRWPRALLRERGDVLAVLIPAADSNGTDSRTYLEGVRVRLGRLVGAGTATIGIGRQAAGPRDIVYSYREAEQAARIGTQFLGGNRTVTFQELGVYRVIARVEDRETLDAFRREYLGPIEDYDASHGGEYIETLEGFFGCNGNHARAAEVLHLHRNTLLYRLERIEALTGRDLGDPETRLSMQLALKIRRVFPTILASQPRTQRGVAR
jgi:PucR family transcriptional regulator, purine catabolism regulatory protein